ncbi:MAG: hypothetical protein IJW06_01750 [Clostridia bacterium]|nr:hypothetical protein [Clostridia bacterium]
MGVASLVLGIVSLVVSVFFVGFNWLAVILGIIGAVLGAIGRKKPEQKGTATAGLVMSIIAVALGVIFWLACAACVGGVTNAISSL